MSGRGLLAGRRRALRAGLAALLAAGALPSWAAPGTQPATAPRLPTLFIIGDSTVNNHGGGLLGWGDPIAELFDRTKVTVVNRARGGRSSRTFLTEGLWDAVAAELRPGDFVLMQFGHNDGGPVIAGRGRASLKGNGEETQGAAPESKTGAATVPATTETVHTYGWYLRKYITDAKAKGATPIVLSPIPRNIWSNDGKTVARASGDYGKWAAEAAAAERVPFVDLNEVIARHYEALGQAKVKEFFPTDHTHTNAAGAKLNAAAVVEGLRGLKDQDPLADYLLK